MNKQNEKRWKKKKQKKQIKRTDKCDLFFITFDKYSLVNYEFILGLDRKWIQNSLDWGG